MIIATHRLKQFLNMSNLIHVSGYSMLQENSNYDRIKGVQICNAIGSRKCFLESTESEYIAAYSL